MVTLRPYQFEDRAKLYEAWQIYRTVLFRADTGYGKSAVLASVVAEHNGYSGVIAHRHELVSQLSLMLAKYGVRHNIIAAAANTKLISELHVAETGYNFYDPNARCGVASVKTLIRRPNLENWFKQCTRLIVDEGHHVVNDNEWHVGIRKFTNPNLKILLPTATPKRADGKGLGSHADGIADYLLETRPMKWLIDEGYLTDYKLALVDSHIEELLGKVTASGDWSQAQLRAASEASPIVGDIVANYQGLASGEPAIVFASDVATATDILADFRRANVRAELVTGDTDPTVRRNIIKQLERGQVQVLVAVDIVSEGFDLPAVRVAILGRATASLALFRQQAGRALRPVYAPGYDLNTRAGRLAAIAASAKPWALFIDHVGNFPRHRPPDTEIAWTLDRAGKRSSGPTGAIPIRVCGRKDPICGKQYERTLSECPYCGTPAPPPADRSSPEKVDGAISLLPDDILAAMRGRVEMIDIDVEEYRRQLASTGLPTRFIMRNVKSRAAQKDALDVLRQAMGEFGGRHHAAGLSDIEIQRLFYFRFGVDVLTAQTLGTDDAYSLVGKIMSLST